MRSSWSSTTADPSGARSVPGLDAYRGALILAMFVVHVARLQRAQPAASHLDALLEDALRAALLVEPYIAAAFLWVAGMSIVLSREHASPSAWQVHVARRVLGLYLLAIALFVAQYGVAVPDLLASPGILSAIALGIALCAAALAGPRPEVTLTAVLAASIAVTAVLDRAAITVPGVNAGPGGAVPLVGFAAAGALALSAHRRSTRGLLAVLALTALVSLPAALSARELTTTRVSWYPDVGGDVAIESLLHPARLLAAPRIAVRFWNHSAMGALALLAPIAVSTWVFVKWAGGCSTLALLGRHALAAYVMHLGLLGVLTFLGLAPNGSLQTWGWVALLSALALAQSSGLSRFGQRRASVRGAG